MHPCRPRFSAALIFALAVALPPTALAGPTQLDAARITALENRGAARIVQRPQIVTLANTEAVFDRTRTFYVRVAGRQQVIEAVGRRLSVRRVGLTYSMAVGFTSADRDKAARIAGAAAAL